jgi:hypothetical protein
MSKDTHQYTQAIVEAWGRHILSKFETNFDDIKLTQGRILAEFNKTKCSQNISDYEFKIFSQWGEDGIIQHLINSVQIENKTFIEFGVEDFFESNCRFLLMKDNWKGYVIDGSEANIARIRASYYFWRHHLNTKQAFITKDNINELLAESRFEEDLGLLSIDLDGIDYFVLEAISMYRPRILIAEFNDVFGSQRAITVPYRADFNRTKAHYSNLYFGASIAAISILAESKGYAFVGTGSMGGNAFFVRSDLLNDKVQQKSIRQVLPSLSCRESRDQAGNLTFLVGDDRIRELKGMPVYNVDSGLTETL